MLEIIFVIFLWKKMGEMMRSRGNNSPLAFQILVPVAWFGGEFLGAFVYGMIGAIMQKQETGIGFLGYVAALLCAAALTGGLFLIVSLFSRREQSPPPSPRQ